MDTCIPVSPGSKPKQKFKLERLVAEVRVPSVISASFFHMARRYLAGKTAGNTIEEQLFPIFQHLSPELRQVLVCIVQSFDTLPIDYRDQLFNSDFLGDINEPNDMTQLAKALVKETVYYGTAGAFDYSRCANEERPGLVRTQPYPGPDVEFPPSQVLICRVNGLRTGQFLPRLAPGDYTLEELQQNCHMVSDQLVCEVQTTNCAPGTEFDGICLNLYEIGVGQTVLLEGMNFSSVDTKVQLMDMSGNVRQLDTFVCGDELTPLTEIINGTEVPIIDCRVHDRLTFRVPEDMVPGLYQLQVVVPNPNHVGGWPGDFLNSDSVSVKITVPSTARFQIASETLHCYKETSPAWIGSDEVGIMIMAIPLFPDMMMGGVQEPNDGKPIRFGNVDNGDTRAMDFVLYSNQEPITDVCLLIKGFEIDGATEFEQEIEEFEQLYYSCLKASLNIYHYGGVEEENWMDTLSGWFIAAVFITFVIVDAIISSWAPADPIISDDIHLTAQDLFQLTSTEFPLPKPYEYNIVQDIKVKVTPLEKTVMPSALYPTYRERREYFSDDEDSRYEIVLSYNRVA